MERFTPSVVVPPVTVRLLNEVILDDGSVLLAVRMTVPLPGVQSEPELDTVIAPFT